MAFGKSLKSLIIPATIPGHPSLKLGGMFTGSISSNAHNAMILSFLSCTRGSWFGLLIALNHLSKNARAMPGREVSIRTSAACGLYRTAFTRTPRLARRNTEVSPLSKWSNAVRMIGCNCYRPRQVSSTKRGDDHFHSRRPCGREG